MIFGLCIRFYRSLPGDIAHLPLVLAPWGLLFYVYDEGAALRKELLGYLALILILQALRSGSPGRALAWVSGGSLVFLAALFAHEAVLLTAPAQVAALALVARRWPGLAWVLPGMGAIVAAASLAIAVWLYRLPAPDIAAIQRAAQMSGLGPFVWLERDLAQNLAFVRGLAAWPALVWLGAIWALCALPLLGFRRMALTPAWTVAVPVLIMVLVLPLFVIAADWGRWVHMAVFPASLILMAAQQGGLVTYRRVLPPVLVLVYLGSWSMMHVHWVPGIRGFAIWPAVAVIWLAVLGRSVLRRG